jgi:hypothetical protein
MSGGAAAARAWPVFVAAFGGLFDTDSYDYSLKGTVFVPGELYPQFTRTRFLI